MKVITKPTCGTKAGWTYHIPVGTYTLTKDLQLYLGYSQTMKDGRQTKGMFTFPKGSKIQSHGHGIGSLEYGVYITSFQESLQNILDNSEYTSER